MSGDILLNRNLYYAVRQRLLRLEIDRNGAYFDVIFERNIGETGLRDKLVTEVGCSDIFTLFC